MINEWKEKEKELNELEWEQTKDRLFCIIEEVRMLDADFKWENACNEIENRIKKEAL